jgi:hypothetical protein
MTRLWITGSAMELLDHYFSADRTKIYMAMTVTESGPVSLHDPYSAFTLPVMDSGSVFGGYYGFVRDGIWRVTEELARINGSSVFRSNWAPRSRPWIRNAAGSSISGWPATETGL